MTYSKYSYESRVLHWLREVDNHLTSNRIHYGLFGGAAVAAYVGHLPRKLHDLDLLLLPNDIKEFCSFLCSRGFKEQRSEKSSKAQFKKFVLANHIYDLIISVFPGKFTLLDVDSKNLRVLGVYDFSAGIKQSRRREIASLSGDQAIGVYAVPLEDLIVSKIWPTFEPNTVHDLLLLLTCTEAF